MDQYPYYSSHPAQQPSFSLYGLPTPNQNAQNDDIPSSFDPLSYQPAFDPSFNPTSQQPFGRSPQSPPDSYTKQSVSSGEHLGPSHYPGSIEGRDEFLADPGLMRSSSEEKDKEGLAGTPAQSKRKAQNRAAQRAFRERKERHVRDLEEKVNNLQQESSTLTADNDRLKRELARYSTENEILRATANGPGSGGDGGDGQRGPASSGPTQTGPMIYSPTDFYSDLVPAGQSVRLHRVTYCKVSGERLYDAGAAWDMIQEHELFKKGLVDIAGVTKRLKSAAQCDGQGPAFRECQIQKAIEESALEDRDGLL
ncbi:hypothetical protein ASPVEDRAFT_30041 [Aspergillus versicolor CBS 583.65]|uniref:BZIP domain-containing protein n=1 Tax=Aspergillus versicolor CBS 583.65 TaxID=1036611 RepID=A0A1L9PPZ9_ASPVE|nr:uncharacterized protein ASPVEDRAFT_30041 [Aspergillus versicolor CBS 583.65]OJJ03526.1 hypothetical protein ASPVEDRAFT_30041 [Aspergillus versicolor CBS 583.65]